MKPVRQKSIEEISGEWDAIAAVRLEQLDGGVDSSFENILAPAILDKISADEEYTILDAGCGSGTLSELIAERSRRVVAIDSSGKSIELARLHHARRNLRFIETTIEDWAERSDEVFDVITANMVLMDVPDLGAVLESLAKLCKRGGQLHATITHPYFWPKYWGYESASWFRYLDEIQIEAPFKISAESTEFMTTHIHRPLGSYTSGLEKAGFGDLSLVELIAAGQRLNEDHRSYPRFILLSAVRK